MKLLLLSGGIESSCLAFWQRPDRCLTVDYGQVCAEMEIETATAIARRLKIPHEAIVARPSKSFGLPHKKIGYSKKPEFWPFRNQFLGTVAAMHSFGTSIKEIWFGTVKGDNRFSDGSKIFYKRLGSLISHQEGNIKISAPAINLTTEQLIIKSKTPRSILGATFSCHRSNIACGDCPGCRKQRELLYDVF